MNKRIIVFISVLISLVLVALVGIQMYWIKNAIAVKQANFERSVTESVSRVIYNLEKIELSGQIHNRMSLNQRGTDLFKAIDSINTLYFNEFKKRQRLSAPDSIFSYSSERVEIEYTQKSENKTVEHFDTTIITENGAAKAEAKPIYAEKTRSGKLNGNTKNITGKMSRHRLKELMKIKFSLIDEVFDDLMNFNKVKPGTRKINIVLIDSLLSYELKKNGIETSYEFGIYSAIQNRIVYEKTGQYSKKLFSRGFGFQLFPSDLSFSPEYLLLYFPHEKRYLFTQLSGMLLISIILIIVIILLFSYTITTIIRQKKLGEMKSDFINNMTHEFKTPISTISLACQALNDNDVRKMENIQENYINIISQENKRLGSMAEKILQTAVIEKGQLKLKKEIIDIHSIIAEVVKNFSLQVDKKGDKIQMELNATNFCLFADKEHITNVINNLLDNANKYTPVTPQIMISTGNVSEGIMITVEDNGIGISKSNQKKIFDNLYRVHTGNVHDVKGFGLGLSYVKAIVNKHDGSVTVESELKKGSIFKIFLPLDNNREN
jgi:two-component system phosphate regulon sensor histidine kinase PhoR